MYATHPCDLLWQMEGDGDDERYRYSVMAARRGGASGGDASGGAVVPSEEAEGERRIAILHLATVGTPLAMLSQEHH